MIITLVSLPLSIQVLASPTPTFSRGLEPSLVDHNLASNTTMLLSIFSLNAIVRLEGLNLPHPKTIGQATIPLQRLEGSQVFTLQLAIGGKSGSFLLDTGASTTMIATTVVQELGLTGEPIPNQGLAYAVAGDDCPNMNAILHSLPPLVINQVRVEELRGLEFSTTVIPEELSGVVGMDFLRNFDLKLNPKNRQLQLLNPSVLPAESVPEAIPLKSRLGVMLTSVKINDQGPFTFLLDTGADTIFISKQLANQIKIDHSHRQPIQVQGFCGLEDAEVSRLEKVTIQDYNQNNLEAVILSSPVLDLLQIDGIIGQSFLNQYQQYWRFNSPNKSQDFEGSLLLVSDKIRNQAS
ncbi:MAG: retropepsin-like aspartic protease [Planktothrix sp. GU0601_MAG3]|nr:MAG: retropepsin-like aspartic protease [Planktothrix sp. GU0601_MAG3]